jgi:hypothetical protein
VTTTMMMRISLLGISRDLITIAGNMLESYR